MSASALKPNKAQAALAWLFLVLLCIPAVLPMAWMASTSLKTDKQVFASQGKGAPPFSVENLLPNPARPENYSDAVKAAPFRVFFRNTVFLVLANTIAVVLSSAIVAYGFARLKFFGKGPFFLAMLSTMAIPPQVTMVPIFVLYSWLGWYGTYLPLIVPYLFGAPFFIFLLTQFFRTIPEEIAESVRLDSGSEWTIFTKIMLPLSKPALATCALFQFVATWNDFLGPLIYLSDPNKYTVAYGLQQFVSKNGGQWTLLMAGATLFMIPVIVVFFFAQKTFVQGIATTGGRN